jgi:hypothetical protein
MESVFKFLFGLAVVVFCMVVIGIFLLIVKIFLIFYPQVHIMGLIIS